MTCCPEVLGGDPLESTLNSMLTSIRPDTTVWSHSVTDVLTLELLKRMFWRSSGPFKAVSPSFVGQDNAFRNSIASLMRLVSVWKEKATPEASASSGPSKQNLPQDPWKALFLGLPVAIPSRPVAASLPVVPSEPFPLG